MYVCFGNVVIFYDYDVVCIGDCGKVMGDSDGCVVMSGFGQGSLNFFFCLVVEC